MLIKMKVFCIRIILLFFFSKKVEIYSTFIPYSKPIRATSELKTFNLRRPYSTRPSSRTGPKNDVKILHP